MSTMVAVVAWGADVVFQATRTLIPLPSILAQPRPVSSVVLTILPAQMRLLALLRPITSPTVEAGLAMASPSPALSISNVGLPSVC